MLTNCAIFYEQEIVAVHMPKPIQKHWLKKHVAMHPFLTNILNAILQKNQRYFPHIIFTGDILTNVLCVLSTHRVNTLFPHLQFAFVWSLAILRTCGFLQHWQFFFKRHSNTYSLAKWTLLCCEMCYDLLLLLSAWPVRNMCKMTKCTWYMENKTYDGFGGKCFIWVNSTFRQ